MKLLFFPHPKATVCTYLCLSVLQNAVLPDYMVEQILSSLQQDANLSPSFLPEPSGTAVPGFLLVQLFSMLAPFLSDG
jgi:hypothetical protein